MSEPMSAADADEELRWVSCWGRVHGTCV